MKVIVLGCGGSAGVPMLGGPDGAGDWGVCDPAEPRNRRSRSAIVVEQDGRRLLVDTPPDLRDQLLRCRVPRIDAIFYTHAHADHVGGVDEVRGLNRIVGGALPTYGSEATLAEIEQRYDYAFRPWTPPGIFRPILTSNRVRAGDVVETCGLALRLFDQTHGRTPTLGFRCGTFSYSTDVNILDEAALSVIAGSDTWMVDCFQRQPHPAHAHVALVHHWAQTLRIRRTVLTHMGTDLDWRWMQDHLPAGLEAAFDGQVITIATP
jgi:phosphoribosyl 1,2-cyclic phosphate phosphodiesterase